MTEHQRDDIAAQQAHIQTRLAFLEELRGNLGLVHEHSVAASRAATDFALLAVRSMYLLNGGALVAVPAFLQIVTTAAPRDVRWIIASFLVGLVLTVAANVGAWLAVRTGGIGLAARLNNRARATKQMFYGHLEGFDPGPVDEREEKCFWWSTCGTWIAFALLMASLGCFMAGGLLTWQVLSEG